MISIEIIFYIGSVRIVRLQHDFFYAVMEYVTISYNKISHTHFFQHDKNFTSYQKEFIITLPTELAKMFHTLLKK